MACRAGYNDAFPAALKSLRPFRQSSVGAPSVIRNTNGRQSPFVSAVVFMTSESIRFAIRDKASPSAVVPLAVKEGRLKLSRSVRGTARCAEELKVITDTNAVSKAYGSCFNVVSSV